MRVIAFDLGRRHFATRGEEITENMIYPLIYDLIDFEEKKVERDFLAKLTDYLESIDFSIYDLILIEGQVSYMGPGKGGSIINGKIQQHLESYFMIRYREKTVEIVSARAKYPKDLSGESDSVRKRWAIRFMKQIYANRGDHRSLKVLESAKTLEKSR